MAEKLIDAAASQEQQSTDGRQVGDVRWTFVKGQTHAFDHFPKKRRDEEETRVRERDLMYQNIVQWLKDVFGTV